MTGRATVDMRAAARCVRIALADCHRRRVKPDEQILAHAREVFRFVDEPDSARMQPSCSHDFIDAGQAAEILGCTPQHVRRIATDLDGIRVGRQLIFDRRTVTEYARQRAAC